MRMVLAAVLAVTPQLSLAAGSDGEPKSQLNLNLAGAD